MGLIKSTNTPPSLSPFSLTDVERHAKQILLRAGAQAEQLLAAAQVEGEELKRQAHEEGLEAGEREGTARGLEQGRQAGQQQALNEHRAQLQQALTAITTAMKSFDAQRADLEANALVEVVELAISIAQRVTKRQGLIEPRVLEANLTEAMKLAVHSTDLRIAIHPSQRATLDVALPQLGMQWPNLSHVQIINDPSLDPGGCKLFTTQGQIDADLQGQLDRIAAELLPMRHALPQEEPR
jgi:flagellar assembly protein FliH